MRHIGKVQGTLGIIILAGFFTAFWLLLNAGKPSPERDALLIMVGALGAALGNVVNFYFGSSAGSARKDEIIAGKE